MKPPLSIARAPAEALREQAGETASAMTLRVVDRRGTASAEGGLEIVFRAADSVRSHAGSVPIELPAWLLEMFERYLTRHPGAEAAADDRDVPARVIRHGMRLGDALLGEAHTLEKYIREIETTGWSNLDVRIESDDPEFFAQAWEALVLPEARYTLAAACRSFVRTIGPIAPSGAAPPALCALGLGVHQDDPLAALHGAAPAPVQPDRPFHVLHLVPFDDACGFASACIESIRSGGAVRHRLATAADAQGLIAEAAGQGQVHALHYRGPVTVDGERVLLGLGAGAATLELGDLAAICGGLPPVLLVLDATSHRAGDAPLRSDLGLATAARRAHAAGIDHVLGFAANGERHVRARALGRVYALLPHGFSIGQAVVEARKGLQREADQGGLGWPPAPLHDWFALCHHASGDTLPFAHPQRVDELQDAAQLGRIRQRLFGFEMRWLPPLGRPVGDGELIPLLKRLASGETVALTGAPGVGRSFLAHQAAFHLVHADRAEFAFCLSAAQELSVPEMVQMISPVLGLEAHAGEAALLAALSDRRCCFVFDDAPAGDPQLLALLERLQAQGHAIVLIPRDASDWPGARILAVRGMDALELRMFAAARLHGLRPAVEGGGASGWLDALIAASGSVGVLECVLPLIEDTPGEVVAAATAERLPATLPDRIEAFRSWRWDALPPLARELLLVCHGHAGLLVEMTSLGARHARDGGAWRELVAALGADADTEPDFAALIAHWRRAHFVVATAIGHVLDPQAEAFIATRKRERTLETAARERAELAFSELVVEGLTRLCGGLMRQPNHAMSYHVLMNRRHWVLHLERLWFGGRHRPFLAGRAALRPLLEQARIDAELGEWLRDLIGRTPLPEPATQTDLDGAMAWLAVAGSVLQYAPEAAADPALAAGADRWAQWLLEAGEPTAGEAAVLTHQATVFMHLFCAETSPDRCLRHGERLLAWYGGRGARAVRVLRVQAACHARLGQHAEAAACEERILEESVGPDAPPGHREQLFAEVALARMERSDFEGADDAIERMLATIAGGPARELADGLRADLRMRQGRAQEALVFYARLAARHGAAEPPAPLRERLQALRAAVGDAAVADAIAREAAIAATAYDDARALETRLPDKETDTDAAR